MLVLPVAPIVASAADADIDEAICNFEFRAGREFLFPSADEELQEYGYVLWKAAPSLAAEPLDYARYQGRRGKLTGQTVHSDGIRWYQGFLDDCSAVYAEDASAHSVWSGMDHLALHGKIVFADNYAAARALIGHHVVVRGEGLEPRHRLYTPDEAESFALNDGEWLRVIGIDMHRYAFAKGVGPFFLQVENALGQQGLIKFNPLYIGLPRSDLPVSRPRPVRERDQLAGSPVFGNAPLPGDADRVLDLAIFRDESDGLAAVLEMETAGFSVRLLPQDGEGGVRYRLQLVGFPTMSLARSLREILAARYGTRMLLPQ